MNWYPPRVAISWACKISYLVYMAVFARLHMAQTMFAFSVWILNDQVEKAFLSEDADRSRRTTHDFWILRLLYPAFLALPWIRPALFAFLWPFRLYGTALFALWAAGLAFVARRRRFFTMPEDPELLRNIVYAKPDTYRQPPR